MRVAQVSYRLAVDASARKRVMLERSWVMQVLKTELDGVLILEPKLIGDARGYFLES